MPVLEITHTSPQELVRDGLHRIHEVIGRVSFRAITREQDCALEALAQEGQLRDVEPPVILPATADYGPRLLQVATFWQGGLDQEIRFTSPIGNSSKSGKKILLRPGFTMEANAPGTARELHDGFADRHKGAVVLTHATPGVGQYATQLSLRQALSLRPETVADDQLVIARALLGEAPIDNINHSMGVLPGWMAAFQNISEPRITYRSITSINGALLPRRQAKRRVGAFAANALQSAARELDGGYPEAVQEGVKLFANLPNACYGNARWLLRGMHKERMEAVVQRTPTLILFSELCPLALPNLYEELDAASNGNVMLKQLAGCDHTIDSRMGEVLDTIDDFMELGFLAAARARRQEMTQSSRF